MPAHINSDFSQADFANDFNKSGFIQIPWEDGTDDYFYIHEDTFYTQGRIIITSDLNSAKIQRTKSIRFNTFDSITDSLAEQLDVVLKITQNADNSLTKTIGIEPASIYPNK